ncbi:hypothetical protein [Rhizobium sp. L1K21]|uniref:hypothetical protein n=1 Tax=Rhizobium sp. L1K21 TaxID=2954933 RepID=UPI002093FB7B|nr:hypothetical protein [Rhizobium sp. L1K21]MCO6188368.1 hypothetical protein [Rhizobium sp. L1K21]
MKSVAFAVFGLAAALAATSAVATVGTMIHNQSQPSSLETFSDMVPWTSTPKRVDVADQNLERLPPRYSSYVTDPGSLKTAANSSRFVVYGSMGNVAVSEKSGRTPMPTDQTALLEPESTVLAETN